MTYLRMTHFLRDPSNPPRIAHPMEDQVREESGPASAVPVVRLKRPHKNSPGNSPNPEASMFPATRCFGTLHASHAQRSPRHGAGDE